MADEAESLIYSVQYDPATRLVTGIDTSKLAALNTALLGNEAGSSMIASRSDMSTSLPSVLVNIINSSVLGAKNRFVALNVLVSLSRCPDEYYRQQVLFPAITGLDASFEGLLMDREDANRQFGTALGKPHEHMIILLFRVTNYSRIKAADLLEQLCDKDDVMLAMILLGIVRVKAHEWPLIVAAVRCLFELSLPQTYFVSSDDNNVTQINAFQQKINALVVHFMQGNTLRLFGDELTERWAMCLKQPVDVVTASLSHFAPILKYFTGLLLNLEEFCDQPVMQKTYQQSLLVQLSGTVTDLLTTYVATCINLSPALQPATGPEATALCSAILGCMRVLRLAYFKPSRGLAPSLVFSLCTLCDVFEQRLSVVRQPVMIPALLLLLEVLANVDATSNEELDKRLHVLLAGIAADDNRVVNNATLCQTLSTLFLNETSVFVVMENETTRAITGGLCGAALDDLVDEIIQYIDKELVLLGVGPSVFEFFIPTGDPQDLIFVPMPSQVESIATPSSAFQKMLSPTAAPSSPPLETVPRGYDVEGSPTKATKRRKHKKSPHPKQYVCMLSGKLMREPVIIKKTGNWFELEELERIMTQLGHVDPITGEAFDEDPEIDLRLQQEIQQYKVLRASKRRHDGEE